MNTKGIITFIGGALLGATAALLLAPDSGENTRNKLKERAKEGYNNLKGKVEECKGHCSDPHGECE